MIYCPAYLHMLLYLQKILSKLSILLTFRHQNKLAFRIKGVVWRSNRKFTCCGGLAQLLEN